MIDQLVLDGTVTTIALAVLLLELAGLLVLGRSRGSVLPLVANALSGAFLILALRAALLDSGATVVAAWLGLGFVAHLADIASRLRRSGR